MSFVKWKFNRMLAVATVVMAVNYLVMLSGSVIVGNLVGADGLAGVNTCTPVFGVASFLASLLSVGSGLVFSRDEDQIWQCSNCGHIVIGKKAPQVCPVCAHPQAYFRINAANY